MNSILRIFCFLIVWGHTALIGYTFTDINGRQFVGSLIEADEHEVEIKRQSDNKIYRLKRTLFALENQNYFDSWISQNKAKSYRLSPGESIRALSRQLRIDLIWRKGEFDVFEIQRASKINGPWVTIPNPTPQFHLYSDYVGEPNVVYFYRVRGLNKKSKSRKSVAGKWLPVVEGRTLPYDKNLFVTELQESCARFFIEEAHALSGLSPEGVPGWSGQSAVGSTGMGMANIIVAVHRGFISRSEGLSLSLRILRFLDTKAEKFGGAFGHWMDGETGRILDFGNEKNAADTVETSFLIQGAILLREYFDAETAEEKALREIVTQLVEGVKWDKFLVKRKNGLTIMWHWHPDRGFGNLPVIGFHEAMMPYILGIGSDTYPIPAISFNEGWMNGNQGMGKLQKHYGIEHSLGSGISWPLFFAHYSHIGLDPKVFEYNGKTYFEHFVDATRIHQKYAKAREDDFKGYDKLWGLAASLSPDGYRANRPGKGDNGTIATTAALSSMPYFPEAVLKCMEVMYLDYGEELWGPYGFYNAINPSRDWVTEKYIGIELGPIAPMIENYRSGLLWELFMDAPEVKRALARIRNEN